MTDAIRLALVLAIPFMLGIVVGIEIVKRRPKPPEELFGQIIRDRIFDVIRHRQWVGSEDGIEVSSTIDLPMPGAPKLKIIVKDAA